MKLVKLFSSGEFHYSAHFTRQSSRHAPHFDIYMTVNPPYSGSETVTIKLGHNATAHILGVWEKVRKSKKNGINPKKLEVLTRVMGLIHTHNLGFADYPLSAVEYLALGFSRNNPTLLKVALSYWEFDVMERMRNRK